jgi:hypothetical protein
MIERSGRRGIWSWGPMVAMAALVVVSLPGISSSAHPVAARPFGPAAMRPDYSTPLRTVSFGVSAAPDSLLGFAMLVNASMGVSSGTMDRGTNLSGLATLAAAPTAELLVGLLNLSSDVAIPTLGSYGPVTVPGLTYNYSGAAFQIAISTRTEITGSLSIDNGSGVNASWAAPGNLTFAVDAPNDTVAGTVLHVQLGAIAYALWVAVNATGSVPLLGAITVPLLKLTEVAAVPGQPATLAGNYTVVARPAIDRLEATPSQFVVGNSTQVSANITGGVPPLAYAWSTDAADCPSIDAAQWTCRPASPGAYSVTLTITDAQGLRASETVRFNATAPPSSASTASSSLAPSAWAVLGGVALAAVGLGAYLLGRRGRIARASDPPPPAN